MTNIAYRPAPVLLVSFATYTPEGRPAGTRKLSVACQRHSTSPVWRLRGQGGLARPRRRGVPRTPPAPRPPLPAPPQNPSPSHPAAPPPPYRGPRPPGP